ncbi:terpene cyclase/mutase family protein [Rhodocytophaga aerolata]|uniref:Terpene cyclase/mutase family protein n=1 Tax=Rhodocytophaga aerolata TaxID=455078 RepID=A0ABT8QXP2_9BACT|nr:prenyltransferase/squalene oxidase repeat-containing protein [Rhodocytophaga aerolata]MDO1444620.1 terpene cyclase/mutase family protein [Rhodocytophaga aerolata]
MNLDIIKSNGIKDCLIRGKQFLTESRSSDGLWRDFKTKADLSSEWVTSFVTYALMHTSPPNWQNNRKMPFQQLFYRQKRNGGWAYNRQVPTDCDSTAWALLALSCCKIWRPSAILRGIDYIRRHQQTTYGGFSTYDTYDGIGRYIQAPNNYWVQGWLQVHPSVTAVALQALLIHGENSNNNSVRQAVQYLKNTKSNIGHWTCYWWKGYAYPTYQTLKSLIYTQDLTTVQYQETINFIIANQKKDGGWNDANEQESEVFATVFNLLTLLLFPQRSGEESIIAAIKFISSKQLSDGSWPVNPILRIPPPMTKDILTVETWEVDKLMTGVIITDQERIFTTAAVIWGLSIYEVIYRNKTLISNLPTIKNVKLKK